MRKWAIAICLVAMVVLGDGAAIWVLTGHSIAYPTAFDITFWAFFATFCACNWWPKRKMNNRS